MKTLFSIVAAALCAALLIPFAALSAGADEEVVYLGDRRDLMLPRDYEDQIGWNTAHSGEKITVWDLSFEKGIGFHCRQSGLAYVEFDISSLDMNWFCATADVLKDATYYISDLYFKTYTREAECRDCNTAGEMIVTSGEKNSPKRVSR